jgi:RNA polymerase sigma factor (sigma-70 family)
MPPAPPQFVADSAQALAWSDIVRLYISFHRRLPRIVRAGVRAPETVIEDACQAAWTALLLEGPQVAAEGVRTWLVRTAVREALRLGYLQAREDSLERALRSHTLHLRLVAADGSEELISRLERVRCLSQLSVRKQRLLWLRALGLSHEEMAEHEHCSYRTVRRQLERARWRLRLLEGDADYRQAARATAPGRACAGGAPPG